MGISQLKSKKQQKKNLAKVAKFFFDKSQSVCFSKIHAFVFVVKLLVVLVDFSYNLAGSAHCNDVGGDVFCDDAPLSITDVALEVGFQEASYFAETFKKTYNCTPSEWRRAHSN